MSKETVVLLRWGIGDRKEIRMLTFRALALRGANPTSKRLTLETSAFESLYDGQFTLSTLLIKQIIFYHIDQICSSMAYLTSCTLILSNPLV